MYNWISKYLPDSLKSRAEAATFLALAGCISLSLVSIAASQILLAATIAGFLWLWKKQKISYAPVKPILLPLLAFMIWTTIAVFASSNISLSLQITKKFFLFLIVLLVPLLVRGNGKLTWIYRFIFAVTVVSSLGGLVQYAVNPDRDLLNRISGFMSQWMTYAGLLMLVLVLLTAYALCIGIRKDKWVIPIAVFIVLALILTLTRNAWAGAIAGIIVLTLMRRPKAIIILFAVILLSYALSPQFIKQRLEAIVSMKDPRFHAFLTAAYIIQDNPWFGVGPKNVQFEAQAYREEKEFPDWLKKLVGMLSSPSQYREEEKKLPGWLYQHMHNNFLQIAAENGIPGLILWLWFMIRLVWDALRCYRHANGSLFTGEEGVRRAALTASSAAIAAWVALMVAGLFEYNFGDSEVLMFFLFLAGSPYAFLHLRPEAKNTNQSASER